MPNVRVPVGADLKRITSRAVAEIVPEVEFLAALRSGRRLRLKMGFDPTRPVITLGWAVGLRKLRQLQDLGHTVVVIIGDWTAQIGDPSGQSQTRPMLSAEEVNTNADAILGHFYRILDPQRTEVRRQSEWFDAFTLADVVRLAAGFTIAQLLERDDFAQRFGAHRPIGVHELLYPLLQGYDSIAVESDVEFGGSDQKFNILVGRELQGMKGQRPQAAFLVPLLVGLDGKQKMSQSLGNFIAIDTPPHDMYGKIMSIPDDVIGQYLELLTDVPDEELEAIRDSLAARAVNPMDVKMRLAREITAQFHSANAAQEAEAEFARVYREGELPDSIVEYALPFSGDSAAADLAAVLLEAEVVKSRAEVKRLLAQGAIEVDGKKTRDAQAVVHPGTTVRVGKHRWLRFVAGG